MRHRDLDLPDLDLQNLDLPDLDLRGLKCPLPVLRTAKALRGLAPGEGLSVRCTDPMAAIDIPNLLRERGDHLERMLRDDGILTFEIRRGTAPDET
ncbi:sulfurtransferase TusA family protein [Methylobacterium sp. SyP6R]|uniref:sulfurtransferase TusA family protein n=1 Tax=Methylobacterium sp. SyP6R TaxID=2718876 RepID=UPI001F1A3304|nr:sulfurtransferase TusA family protein [Methylobacterium sp. SyP6R]MCF4124239.1 sulfurtransferase TusA family protein [Methylobacterium sp. SyP6R]